jgi:hypothetical protein
MSLAPAQEASRSNTEPVAFTGYIETTNGTRVQKVSFREPPGRDGTAGRLIVLDVQADGIFISKVPLPDKFVVKTFPPCLPIRTLVAAERRVVSDGAQVSGAGVTANAYGGKDLKLEVGFGMLKPLKGLDVNFKLGGVDFTGCPGS